MHRVEAERYPHDMQTDVDLKRLDPVTDGRTGPAHPQDCCVPVANCVDDKDALAIVNLACEVAHAFAH
jgi:hypothetical protein